MYTNKALLMGFGIQGHGALYDLLKFGNFEEIRVLDSRSDLVSQMENFSSGSTKIVPICEPVSDRNVLKAAMNGVDIAICLLPRDFALPMGELAVEMGVNYACASYLGSFCSDDVSRIRQEKRMTELNNSAKKKNLCVLTQCGLDPGLDLLLAGEAVRQFDKVDDFISYGAGFPELSAANNSLRYKFTWTVEGVMRSYYRPAKVIRDRNIIDIAANEIFFEKNTHTLKIDELGEYLECFPNGDSVAVAEELGIIDSVNSMGRYVCRWPGHCAFWGTIANCGFLNDGVINVDGKDVNRISFMTKIFSSNSEFFYKENERDVTLTRIDIKGEEKGKKVREIYQIIDKKDMTTGFTSMTRTVGFVLSLGAIMIKNNQLEKGMLTPIEMPYSETVKELKKRDICVTHQRIEL